MAQTVLLKRSSVAGNVPGSSDLALGEIAVNTADGAVYIKKGNNDIVAVADNDILHIDTTNSRIGIGTTSPSNSLHVNSGTDDWPIRAQSTDAKTGIIIQDTNTTNYLISESYTLSIGNQASLHASNLNIKSTGNVGIGTTNPIHKLDVRGGNMFVGGYGSGADYGMIFSPADTASYWHIYNDTGGELVFGRNGTVGSGEKARFDSSGNLLVGTTSAANASAGFRAYAGGNGAFTRASTVLDLNRLSTDGVILNFQKDTVNVGSIGTVSNGKLMMGVGGSSGTNLIFADAFDEIYPSQNGVTTLGDPGSKFKDLHLSGNANIGGNAVITGDLTVNGSTTTLNVATLDVEDKNITLNKGSGDTSGSANGAGITIQDAVDASTDASMTWNNSSNLFSFSNKVDVQGDLQAYNIYAQDYHVLNSAGNGWHEWATRSDDRVNLSVHDISTNGTVGIGTAATSDSLRILQSGTNASAVYATDGTSWLRVVPNLGGGGFNPIVSTGDIGLIFSTDNDTSTNTSGALVLAPHSNTIGGIKIREDGRVGIGTAAPSTTFHVLNATTNGEVMRLTTTGDNPDRNMYFQSDHIYSDGSFYLGSGSHRNLYRGSYHTFHYGSSNTEAMRVHTDGNVGIGTSSPSAKLDVRSSADPADGTLMFLRNDVSSGNGAFIRYDVNNVGDWAIGIPDNRNAFTIWKDQGNTGTEYFTVNSNGNVGIGTNNPQFDLDVTGLLRVTSDAYLQGDVYVNSKIRHNGDVDNYITFSAADTQGFITGNSTRLQITNSLVRFNQENNNQDFSVYSANSDNMLYVDASTDRVGIGTATPSKPLHIQFSGDHGARIESEDNHASLYIDSHTAYGQYIRFSENNANKYWIQSTGGKLVFRPGATSTVANQVTFDSTGKVGIGTASLTNKFHVSGDARIEGSLMAGGAAASNVPARPIHVKSAGDAAAIRIEDTTSSNLVYDMRVTHGAGLKFIDVTNNATRMTLTDGGQVAINTDTARTTGGTARLTISDSASCINMGPSNSDLMYIRRIGAGQFQMQTYNNNNTGNLELQPYGGKVGIGTGSSSNPQATFQVEEYGVDTTSTSSTATTQIAIHTFAAATFRSARFTVQVTNSTDSTYHTTELLLVHNGTTANITEFGEIHTGSAVEATFDADISSGNVRLLATPASTDTMAFKVVCHSITT